MTDKELLELAAKAAGYNVRWHELWRCFVHEHPYNTDDPPTPAGRRDVWSPLTDDGDALRLAVNIGLVVEIGYAHRGFIAVRTNTDNWKEFREPYGECAYAATRRAIVRAAAEIGRTK